MTSCFVVMVRGHYQLLHGSCSQHHILIVCTVGFENRPIQSITFPVFRHRYSQYLTAQVIGADGQSIKSTKSSFCHFLSCLEWVPAYRPLEGEQRERKYLRPNAVYPASPEVTRLLGTHVHYVDIDPSEFSRALGKMGELQWTLCCPAPY